MQDALETTLTDLASDTMPDLEIEEVLRNHLTTEETNYYEGSLMGDTEIHGVTPSVFLPACVPKALQQAGALPLCFSVSRFSRADSGILK